MVLVLINRTGITTKVLSEEGTPDSNLIKGRCCGPTVIETILFTKVITISEAGKKLLIAKAHKAQIGTVLSSLMRNEKNTIQPENIRIVQL
jgi:hypothetical protein